MWHLAPLRKHIEGLEAERQYLTDVVNSIGRGSEIFQFHLHSAREAFRELIDEDEPAGPRSMEYVLGASDRQDDYRYAKLANEANLIACLHTVRNQWDIFAQIVNGLMLVPAIPISSCTLGRVQRTMPASKLKDELGDLLQSDSFAYLLGFINTAKHRKLIQHGFFVSFVDDSAGAKVGAFEYEGRSFPQRWCSEVLECATELHNAVVSSGRTLNKLCGVLDDA